MTKTNGSELSSPAADSVPVMGLAGAGIEPCEVCGNEDGSAFQILFEGEVHSFDSFECAIHALAPVCDHCGCRIIGHAIEVDGDHYCCVYCAEQVSGVRFVLEHSPA